MMDTKIYDAIVIVTPADFKRVECNNQRIVKYLPVRKVLFVGSEELKELWGSLILVIRLALSMKMILYHLMRFITA